MYIAFKIKEHRAPIGAPLGWLLWRYKHIAPPEHDHCKFSLEWISIGNKF